MKVLIVAEYLDDIRDPKTYNSRFLTVADQLTERGHTVHIVTTDFIHSAKRHLSGVISYKDCGLTALHEPGYKKNVCLKRFYSHWVLSLHLKKWLKTIEKPDVIYCAVPSLDFAYRAARYAKRNGVRFVLDIQDLWPEAFEMVIPIPYLPKLAFWPLRLRANRVYASADAVVSVSETYIDRVRSCGVACEHMKAVYLGTDLSKFDAYRESIVNLSKKEGDIWLSYVGTLGHSYDLITVFDALDHLKNHPLYEKIKFIVAGDGPLRQTFEEYAKSKELPVEFTGRLPYPEMVSALCMCDIAVNPIKKKSAGSIINKHGDYAAAGIPVLNTQESAEYRSLVDTYGMGLNCECENARDVADKLTELLESEAKRVAMGQNARRCAEERFDRAGTYRHIVQMIEQI